MLCNRDVQLSSPTLQLQLCISQAESASRITNSSFLLLFINLCFDIKTHFFAQGKNYTSRSLKSVSDFVGDPSPAYAES